MATIFTVSPAGQLADLCRGPIAVHHRHAHIHPDKVGLPLLEQGDTLCAVFRPSYLETRLTMRTLRKDLEEEKVQLQKALDNIKTLKGLLPICAKCKNIREDTGYWKQIEEYIQDHSDASFTHGICPVCEKEKYGNQEWYKK